MLFSIVLTIGLLITGTNGYDSNAGTCNAAQPLTDSGMGMVAYTRTQNSGASSNFALSVTPTSIVPGQAHNITLMRTAGSGGFRGLLLYVEDVSQTRIGTYTVVAGLTQTMPASPVAVGTCGGTTTTLTHVSGSAFAGIQKFEWTAPAMVNGPVTINAVAYETCVNSGPCVFNVPSPLTVPVGGGSPGTSGPTSGPTGSPATTMPSSTPTGSPSANPSTSMPSKSPSAAPSKSPSTTPSKSPSTTPSKSPTMYPTSSPGTTMPSNAPSKSPSQGPSKSPSMSPSSSPATTGPSKSPSKTPSMSPTRSPFTREPSKSPTQNPSMSPSKTPSKSPSQSPSMTPTKAPSNNPSGSPTKNPTATPSTSGPTGTPTTSGPSATPTKGPTASPSMTPTAAPTGGVGAVCGTNDTTTLGFGISFAALENGNQAAVYVVGPTAGWFGVGFGTNMIGSIAFVAQVGQNVGVYTPLNTRTLAGVGSPRTDVANFTTLSDVVTANSRSICLLFGTNQPASGIDFRRHSVPLIYATSTTDGNLTAAGHGTNRGENAAVIVMRTYSTTAVPGLPGGVSRVGGMWMLAVAVGVLGYVGFV